MCGVRRADCLCGVVGVLERDGSFLMIKRSAHVQAAHKWCFPGGAIEAGETAAEAVVREFREELGLEIEAGQELWSWLREDGRLHLEWHQVRHIGGKLRLKADEVAEAKWMTDEDMHRQADLLANNLTFLTHYRSLPT